MQTIINIIKLPFAWIISTFLFLTTWLPFYILGFFVTWIGLLFCTRNSEHMSVLFWPWDNSHGINGTLNGNNPKWVKICNPWIESLPEDQQGAAIQKTIQDKSGNERKFKNRWTWITWRNPVSNPSMYWTGIKSDGKFKEQKLAFGPLIINVISSGIGWLYMFTFKYNSDRGFYYAFGWKYNDLADGIARFMYRISPYKSIR